MGEAFTLRGYVVEQRIGRGASGDVWRARAAGSGAPVALKRIWAAGEDDRQRACTEAALLRTLDHPNLIRLHAVVPTADAVVLVLDLADGGALADLLGARGRLAPGEVITAVAPVAAALAYLHEGGVVHGDVSPGNVLFTAGGVPLLADVGVARLLGDEDAASRATPAYVDPTVAAGHLPGPPSDVFMLAGVALHALTGTPPWPGDAAEALDRAAGGDLTDVPPRLAQAGVPAGMTEVLLRALDPDPGRRGTAADLALDLRHAGRPVAVELGAGRVAPGAAAWSGPRHAAHPASERAGRTGEADPARPAFARPSEADAPAEPPTRMVGPRPRPAIPRPPRRPTLRRRLLALGASVAAVLAAAGGIAWATAGQSGSPAADPRAQVETHAPSPVRSSAGSAPAGSSAPPARATRSAATPSTTPSAAGGGWRQALAALDAVRARAFADREPAALSRVYASATLAAADAGVLRRLVPTGCGLRGVRTDYADVVVSATRRRATLLVTATLPETQLVCGDRVRASVPGAGPTRLRVVLVRTAAGPRIAAQALVSG